MVNSSNLTRPARSRQWNDLITTGSPKVYDLLARIFDEYAQDEPVAEPSEVGTLGDYPGCDVKVVTTLAGRGVNQALKATYGRASVPMRRLAWDRNGDGVPDRYLHQKSLAISGVFADDSSASVVPSGSPNWSLRAARSEEVWMRVLDRPAMTRRYVGRVDRLVASPFSSSRVTSRAELHRSLVRHGRVRGQQPEWLELD